MNQKFEQKNNSGALFKNLDKTEETHSDYNGTIRVDGKDYWLNAWVNTSKDGLKYMSVSVKPKQGQAAKVNTDTTPPDDEMPF